MICSNRIFFFYVKPVSPFAPILNLFRQMKAHDSIIAHLNTCRANRNHVCVTLLVIALVVYAFLMGVVCRRMDQHDARKGGILYLKDNSLTDKQRFEIIVETGFRRGAGTTAKVGNSN